MFMLVVVYFSDCEKSTARLYLTSIRDLRVLNGISLFMELNSIDCACFALWRILGVWSYPSGSAINILNASFQYLLPSLFVKELLQSWAELENQIRR